MTIAAVILGGCTSASDTLTPAALKEPAVLQVSSIAPSKVRVAPGEAFRVDVTVKNEGGQTGDANVALLVDGSQVQAQAISVEKGQAKPLTFSLTLQTPGTHIVLATIDGLSLVNGISIQVLKPARLDITRLALMPSEVQLGDSVVATISIVNTGELPGTGSIRLTGSGQTLGTTGVAADGGITTERTISFTPSQAGTMVVSADAGASASSATLRVLAPKVADAQWRYEDLWCTDSIPFTVTFRNAGDGLLRGGTLTASVYNLNKVEQDTKSVRLENITAGSSATVRMSLFGYDRCGSDDYYYIEYTITPTFGEAHTAVTRRFSI